MDRSPRRLIAATLGALMVCALGISAAAGGEEEASVVIRLSVSGPVPAEDGFTIIAYTENPRTFVDSGVPVCGPSPHFDRYSVPVCSATTYEFAFGGGSPNSERAVVGGELRYGISRWDGSSQETIREVVRHIIIPSGTTTLSLEYVYPSESGAASDVGGVGGVGTASSPATGAQTSPVVLPDTAVTASPGTRWVLVMGGVALLGLVLARGGRRARLGRGAPPSA